MRPSPVELIVELLSSLPSDDQLERMADNYEAAFSVPPYREGVEQRKQFFERVRRYAGRDGFGLVLARDGEEVVGMALGVTAHPGDWWRDQVAAALAGPEVDRWLGTGCLEVVHVGVRPDRSGAGIGGEVHDRLIERPAPATAVLSVHPHATAAQRLYWSRGWTVLREDFRIGEHMPYWLMGKRLD